MKEAIKGLNQEKMVLTDRLGELTGGVKDINTRYDIKNRLEQIDKMILELLKTPEPSGVLLSRQSDKR